MTRLLYLGFAFPPGLQALVPGINPAGHAFETQMVQALRTRFELRSAGVLPGSLPDSLRTPADPASGVAHELLLFEKPPELLHRWRSLNRLKFQFLRWRAEGWVPEVVLVYNLSPIYNNFLRWLRKQPNCPKLVLLLLDSSQLGRTPPPLKRLRHYFKPLFIPDDKMIGDFDACIGLSQSAEKFFQPRKIPFLWMPGGCTPQRALPDDASAAAGDLSSPVRFGYFGALAAHAGVLPLVETFLATPLAAELHVCGYGKVAEKLDEISRREPRLKFHGLLPAPDDCLRFGRSCDVLVNPRPASHGNENNFPSKIFEYALAGRAILTSRLAGVDTVLGPEAFYFDPYHFNEDLRAQLTALTQVPRAELGRRGIALRRRVLDGYSWPQQAAAMSEFIARLA